MLLPATCTISVCDLSGLIVRCVCVCVCNPCHGSVWPQPGMCGPHILIVTPHLYLSILLPLNIRLTAEGMAPQWGPVACGAEAGRWLARKCVCWRVDLFHQIFLLVACHPSVGTCIPPIDPSIYSRCSREGCVRRGPRGHSCSKQAAACLLVLCGIRWPGCGRRFVEGFLRRRG